jgi:Xaa-Pro aminopeptidase
MAERSIDALVVEGPDGLGSANPAFNYFVKGQQLTGTVIKRRGEPALLIHSPWEQHQAEATGLRLVSRDRWNMREILRQFPDRREAAVEYRRRVFAEFGIRGRVGFYGVVHAGPHFALLASLAQRMPDLEIVAEFDRDIISLARLTKESDEVELMREVGRRTCAVVQAVVAFIRSCRADGDTVVDPGQRPVTIGDIHQLIQREAAAEGLDMPHGVIFAQGRDAGLPHAHGEPTAPLRLGQAIVFDIYPRQQHSGYFHDMTRTFAIGYAPPELQQLYNDVLGAYDQVIGELEVGAPTKPYQNLVCAYFEARGHPTIASIYPIEEGYIHGLGHGIGLEVHEDFHFPSQEDRGDRLLPGAVFTIEPGLYYPSRGLGARIEDTLYCRPDGTIESLTPFPKDLVIPLDG